MPFLDEVTKENAAQMAQLPTAAHQCGSTVTTSKDGQIKRLSVYFNAGDFNKPAYAPLEHAAQIFADGDKGFNQGDKRYCRVQIEIMHTPVEGSSRTAKANIVPYEAVTLFDAVQYARFNMLPVGFAHENDLKVFGEGENGRYSSLVIRYQPEYNGKRSMMPWYFEISNGTCFAERTQTGQIKAKSGSLKEEQKLTINLSSEELGKVLYSCKLCIENFASVHYPKMFSANQKLRALRSGN